MRDTLLQKIEEIHLLLNHLESHLQGKKQHWETDYELNPARIMSEAMYIFRQSGELVQNILKSEAEKSSRKQIKELEAAAKAVVNDYELGDSATMERLRAALELKTHEEISNSVSEEQQCQK